MMFDSKDFLQLIQEGKISPDTITADFTKALNEALAIQKKQEEEAARKKAEEEAARKREELKAALEAAKAKTKLREADDIAARLTAFMKTHYGDIYTKLGEEPAVSGTQLVEALDQSVKMLEGLAGFKSSLEDLAKFFDNENKIQEKVKIPTPPPMPVDPIHEFLRKNGL